MLTLLLMTALGAHASCSGEACAGGVSVGITFKMTIIESAELAIDTRETGIDGVAIVDVEAGGQGVAQVRESALVIAGSSPIVITREADRDERGRTIAKIDWRLPADALAWRVPPGQEAQALAWVAKALRHKAPRSALAAMLQKAATPAQVPVLLAGVR